MSRSTKQILLVVVTLLVAAGAAAALISSRKEPQRVERPHRGPLVEVTLAEVGDVQVEVAGQGEVSPRIRVDLTPQVTGRVVGIHRGMRSGGRFRAGEILLRIDSRDYELAVERARASVASAETVLEREEAEGEAARAEWADVRGEEEPPTLLVRAPQIREAQARLAAAKADLAKAELDLERTRLTLPFDGVVIEESVDPGQLVNGGQRVATVYGTAQAEVRVPLDDRELAWFDPDTAPAARVTTEVAGATHTWEGRVERLEGQVDPKSRMVHVVVTVDRPFDQEGKPPLLTGSFVEVSVEGQRLEGVVAIPRHALRPGNTVWVVDGDHLRIREVQVARRDREQVLLNQGLDAGEMVVISSLDAVTDGMTIRLPEGVNHG